MGVSLFSKLIYGGEIKKKKNYPIRDFKLKDCFDMTSEATVLIR